MCGGIFENLQPFSHECATSALCMGARCFSPAHGTIIVLTPGATVCCCRCVGFVREEWWSGKYFLETCDFIPELMPS